MTLPRNASVPTAVAMSGGVDSSVAAVLLAREQLPLVGFSMRLVAPSGGASETERTGRCCSPDDFRDARAVADRLGVPHYVLDLEREFRERILGPFAEDYASGRTPSPCVRCNTHVKLGALLDRARAIGAERVATGHYAILEPDPRSGRTLLRRAVDRDKDQSYFLFDLSEEQRRAAVFPLGCLTKEEVRGLARGAGLAVADKPESMDLCFVERGESYRDFLARTGMASGVEAGEIVDGAGRILGRHAGVSGFTVGQRRGLRLAAPRPLYVVRVEPDRRRVVVGEEPELYTDRCVLERCRWIPFERPGRGLSARVRIRSGHDGAEATVTDLDGGRAEVRFAEGQRALAAGQAAVAYDGDLVLGGGWVAA